MKTKMICICLMKTKLLNLYESVNGGRSVCFFQKCNIIILYLYKMMTTTTTYRLIPHYSKSLTETQCWNRTLKNGKSVTLKVSNVYRCFKIDIELDDAEKAEILKMHTIQLDNYSFTPDEMEGCDCWHEILNIDHFTEEEKEEIDEDNIDIDFLDDSDEWTSTYESSYELSCGCDLVENYL